ncbi:MAG: DNA gyrase subunit A [Deltaproteobacteria bacterium]|nr:DNA gyrase subunit A [Deltaproteobacteria bacterium]
MTKEAVVVVPIEEEMKKSYLDYAMSTIIGRALPDVRDGLKPVHRRILYAMYELGNFHDKPYKKSARVVGDVIGKYHPHGDQAVYDAITRMVQDFSLRYPLIDGQGNFGSIDGDEPAAMRYTEIRLSKIAEELLTDIEKDTVDFRPNYDESLFEPQVLPSRIPNLLVNGSSGIAVGMATNIPPHNLREIVDAVLACIDNPDISTDELMKIVPGPDFPTRGIIYGRQGIREAYETGKGHIVLRARVHIEQSKKDGKVAIVVTEIPYQVNKARLIESIVDLVNTRKIEGISNIRDESSREGMRIVIELKRGESPMPILNKLYKHTQLQTTFGIIFLTIVNNEPKTLNLKGLIKEFISFRKEIVKRRSQFELHKAQERLHILEGIKLALTHIDEIIALIKKSRSVQEAKEGLIKNYGLTEKQSSSILEMRLQRLTSLERQKILEEYSQTEREIERLTSILREEKILLSIIKDELIEIKEKYGDERFTEILDELPEISVEDMIKEEEVVVTITHRGFIKRTSLDQYKHQARGGKGKLGIVVREEDVVEHIYTVSTHSHILFFTKSGKAYGLKVYAIPEAPLSAKGKPILNLISIDNGDEIAAVTHVDDFSENRFLFFVTKKGYVKRIEVSELGSLRTKGIKAINIPEDDKLVGVLETDGKRDIIIATKRGMSIRIRETDIRTMGRGAYGVIGIKLKEGDEVASCDSINDDNYLFTVTERGYGKCTVAKEYKTQSRGGFGVINVRITPKNGSLVCVKEITQRDELILITDKGRTIRFKVSDIPVQKRGGIGVKLMDVNENERITGVAKVTED